MRVISGYIYLIFFFILEGLFPIFSYFAQKTLPTFWLIAVATGVSLFLGLIVFIKKKLYLQYYEKGILAPTLFSALFMGTAGILYFFGIEYSSPSVASVLLLLQSLFAFIVFNVFGKEKYGLHQILGAILMFIGGFLVLYQGDSFVNIGAIIMIIACVFFTLGNFYMKKASKMGANPFFLLVHRNLFMVIITTVFASIFVGPLDGGLVKENITWILSIGLFVLFLGKAAWTVALDRLNPFVAISAFPAIPVFVMVFSFFILKDVPTSRELLAFIPIILGAFLLVKQP